MSIHLNTLDICWARSWLPELYWKHNRSWHNSLTWPQNEKFICLICWLLVCLICEIIMTCWSYFCINPLFTCCLMGDTKIWQLIGYFGKTRTRYFWCSFMLGQFWVAFLDTWIFHYLNCVTRIIRTSRAINDRSN